MDGRVGLRNGWMGGRRDEWMSEWVGLRVSFININDMYNIDINVMYNIDVGKGGVSVYEAY